MSHPFSRALVGAAVAFLACLWATQAGLIASSPVAADAVLVLAAVLGAIAGLRRWTTVPSIAAVAAALLALVFLFTPVMRGPIAAWIRVDSLPPGGVDAVVVLSSGVTGDGALDAEGTARLVAGARELKTVHAKMLITTRTASGVGRQVSSDAAQRALVGLAGDSAAWRVVGPVGSTRDEAVAAAALLAPAASHRIAVVTSPLHTRRACAAFEAVGFHVICVAADEPRYAPAAFATPDGRLAAIRDYLYERLAMLKYSARGWI